MKKNKILAIAMSLALGTSILAGCSSTPKEDPVVMTINGYEVKASEYAFSLNRSFMEIDAQLGGLLSSGQEIEGMPSKAEVFDMTKLSAVSSLQEKYAIQELLDSLEITQTPEDEEKLNAMIEQTKQQLGGIQGYKQALRNLGITDEFFRADNMLTLLFQNAVLEEYGNGLKTDEELYKIYEEEFMHAQHILISTQEISAHADDDGHEHPESFVADSLATAKKTSEEALKRAKSGEEFSSLMGVYSDDPGQPLVGYAFKEGYMIAEFEAAVKSLEVNEISEVIDTTFGHHIIKKIEPSKENFEANKDMILLGDGEKLATDAVTVVIGTQKVENLDALATITSENYKDFLIFDK